MEIHELTLEQVIHAMVCMAEIIEDHDLPLSQRLLKPALMFELCCQLRDQPYPVNPDLYVHTE